MSARAAKLAHTSGPSWLPPKAAGERCRIDSFRAGGIITVDTHDYDEFCRHAPGWTIDHQLIGRGNPHIKRFAVLTPFLQIGFTEHLRGYCSQGDVPKGTVTLWAPTDHSRPVVHRGHSVETLDVIATKSGEGFELVNRLGARLLTVAISETLMERYAAVLWDEPREIGRAADRLHFSSMAARRRFVDTCQGLLKDVRRQPDLLENPQWVSLLEEKLVEKLVVEGAPEPTYACPPYRQNAARRAYQYIQQRIEEPVAISELCAVTGTCYGTLEKGFLETYGMSPLLYLRTLRLFRARHELRQPNQETTVTGVAMRWGFLELGRFSIQYRERFGESPSETLRKARGDSLFLEKVVLAGNPRVTPIRPLVGSLTEPKSVFAARHP